MDPEFVHDRFVSIGSFLGQYRWTRAFTRFCFHWSDSSLSQKIGGLVFENPVGLSAGFDKSGKLTQIIPDIGFSYMQIGSVTAHPYEGNPRPRLRRLKKSKALVVYYGLKNDGVEVIISRLKKAKKRFPWGFSVAKTNSRNASSCEDGIKDYIASLKALESSGLADFYTINISCPNTFGGEPYVEPHRLKKLLEAIEKLKIKKPIFLKMPINLKWKDFKSLLEVISKFMITGLVIGNLNKDHKGDSINDVIPKNMKGGISGKPCQRNSDRLISKTYKDYGDQFIIIGVGGVFTVDDAWEKIRKGASLIQLITGMIYMGPQQIGEINKGIAKRLKREGYTSVSQLVGSAHRS